MPNHRSRLAALPLLLLVVACAATPAPTGSPGPTAGSPTPTAPPSSGPSATPSAPPATSTPAPSEPPGSPSPGAGWPQGPTDLILRVDSAGGLAGPNALPGQIPGFSLYGDGRFVLQGATTMIFPGPLLPPIMEMRLTPAGIRLLLDAARSAGLAGPDRQMDFPGIADAMTTSFTIVTDAGRHVTSVYALHEAAGQEGRLPANERAARAALLTFESQLFDLQRVLGAEVGPAQGYVPTAMRIYVQKAQGPIDPNLPPQNVAWPLGDLAAFGEEMPAVGVGVRCGVLDGADLETVMPLFTAANQLTRWISSDVAYTLTLRPLLPDEDGCLRDQ